MQLRHSKEKRVVRKPGKNIPKEGQQKKTPYVWVCAGESLSEVVLPPAGVAEKHTECLAAIPLWQFKRSPTNPASSHYRQISAGL